eukprot:3246984-Rhodomonas_salina.1
MPYTVVRHTIVWFSNRNFVNPAAATRERKGNGVSPTSNSAASSHLTVRFRVPEAGVRRVCCSSSVLRDHTRNCQPVVLVSACHAAKVSLGQMPPTTSRPIRVPGTTEGSCLRGQCSRRSSMPHSTHSSKRLGGAQTDVFEGLVQGCEPLQCVLNNGRLPCGDLTVRVDCVRKRRIHRLPQHHSLSVPLKARESYPAPTKSSRRGTGQKSQIERQQCTSSTICRTSS